MPVADLKGKTVMILDGGFNSSLLDSLSETLRNRGANIVLGSYSAWKPGEIDLICDEVKQHEPKIDAVIINNTDLTRRDALLTAIGVATTLKTSMPVIAHDFLCKAADMQLVQAAGAECFSVDNSDNQIAFAVADAIAQRGKPGRTVGAK
jgi:hypothetical protein